DTPCEGALQCRIGGIESLDDEFRVLLALGKDDGLAQSVAASDANALGHKVFEDLVHGVLVEEPVVESAACNLAGHGTGVIPIKRVPHLLLVGGEIRILD